MRSSWLVFSFVEDAAAVFSFWQGMVSIYGTGSIWKITVCILVSRSLRGFPVSRVLSSALVEPLSVPGPDGVAKVYPDKIRTIVENISQLTLLETAQLNELLKVMA